MSITHKEIMSQYKALSKTLLHLKSQKEEIIAFFNKTAEKNLILLGCGSSYSLCKSAELAFAARKGIKATVIPAGDILVNLKSYEKILSNSVVFSLSRSGSTTEVIETVKQLRSLYASPVFSLCCAEASDLSKISDLCIEMPWAFDESICQTRCVTNFYTSLLLIAAYISGDTKLEQDIEKAVEAGEKFLQSIEGLCKEIGNQKWENVLILADGEMQGIAEEAALAFTEIAQIPGNYYHLLDSRHGPFVLVNEKTLVIINISNGNSELQKAFVSDISKKGATVLVFNTDGKFKNTNTINLSLGQNLDDAVAGIPFINIAQLIALYKSYARSINPDNPDGLDAWIKL